MKIGCSEKMQGPNHEVARFASGNDVREDGYIFDDVMELRFEGRRSSTRDAGVECQSGFVLRR